MTTLIVGLGNPGGQYQNNRHNIGFMLIEAIAHAYDFPKFEKKFSGEFAQGFIGKHKVMLLKPQTFMNLSGKSVLECSNFYKIAHEKILVLHDELDLVTGRIKVKFAGHHAGHNGLKSIDAMIGENYHRLRFGISRPIHGDVSNYVLGNFNETESKVVEQAIKAVVFHLPLILAGDSVKFMNNCALDLKGE
jgi:PTH1 family peptidyl-tRNA hydrolase